MPHLKNRAAPEIEAAIVAIVVEQPAWGQARAANELKKRGRDLSPFGVRSTWFRHDLGTEPPRFCRRLFCLSYAAMAGCASEA